MVLVIGTNAGFVTVAPVADPTGGWISLVDDRGIVTHDTSPADAFRIIEIGWWCNNSTEESNFEVGLYAADGAVVPGEAGTLLYVDRTNAKGITAGWKVVTGLNWVISSNTAYWLGVQVDNTSPGTSIDREATGGTGYDVISSISTLPNPFGGGTLTSPTTIIAIYALYEVAVGTNIKINIADVWKDVDLIKINIGDTWKEVAEIKQNIGDVWKKGVY